MAVLPTNRRPSAADEKDRGRGSNSGPSTADEESKDREAGTSDEARIPAVADSPTTAALCSATATAATAVLATKRHPSAAQECKDGRRGRNGGPSAAGEESTDRTAGTSDEDRITAAVADSPPAALCSATDAAAMAVLATKRRPSPSAAAEEESNNRAAARARSDNGRVTAVADSYQMLKRIGEGAFGAVTVARHIESGEIVAIKSSINPDGDGDGDRDRKAVAAELLREAAMLTACVGNPAVVRLREVARGSDMCDLHLVMEYVGRSLAAVIKSRRRRGQQQCFSESEARGAMAQLLAGVSTMHQQGFVHCDLKPANILVGEGGQLRICDLGLAKSFLAPPTDSSMEIEGTPGYMAPELLLSQKDRGTPVDIWALGCILAEILAGEPLFKAEDLFGQLISIVHVLGIPDEMSLMPLGASPPSKLRERVPEKLLSLVGFDVLQGLLEYDPKNRLTADSALEMPWFETKDD